MRSFRIVALFTLLVLVMTASLASAAPAAQEGQDYFIQKDDWLSKLADRFLGNILAYPAIVEATNELAATDPSYTFISNPDWIEPGWKVRIPSTAEAEALMTKLTPVRGGTLVVGMNSASIDTLDPADYRDRATETVIRNMFDGLVTRTNTNRVVLELAESAELIDDTTWEFKLKPGVTFHNGEPLTAEDVKFSLERVITEGGIECPEPHTAARKGLISPLESVEVVDDLTVRLHLSAPWPPAMQMIVHQQIMPKDYYESVGCEGFREKPIGTGPFKFVEGTLDDQIVMERYDGYYGGADLLPPRGTAFLDRVIFKMIPESSTRMAALQAGEIHIAQGVPAQMVDTLRADPNVVVKTTAGTRPHWMEMNVHQPPFDDVRVRQAMNYAVDPQVIIDTVLGGRGVVLAGALSPYNNFADRTLKPYGYDPDKAKALLAEAGLAPGDISFVIDTSEGDREEAEALAGLLQAFGVDASVRVWDWSVVKPMLLNGERMAAFGSWGDSAFDPVGHFEAKWHTYVEGTAAGRGNYSTYSVPRVDELIEAGETEPDPTQRHVIYDEAQQIVYSDAPAIFLYLPEEVEASSARVQNWAPSPDSRINLHDVWMLPE